MNSIQKADNAGNAALTLNNAAVNAIGCGEKNNCSVLVDSLAMDKNSRLYSYGYVGSATGNGLSGITAYLPEGYTVGEYENSASGIKKAKYIGSGGYPARDFTLKGEGDCPAAKFTDTDLTKYSHEALDWAIIQGVTTGTTATTFSPDMVCTRAQAVTFLYRAAGSPAVFGSNAFTDAASDAYYASAVQWAVSKGITRGTSDTAFSPDQTCDRAQIVTLLYRYAGSPAPATDGDSDFSDAPSGAYYENAVIWATAEGVTTGTGAGQFSPGAACTRAQIATFLYRAAK